MPGPTFTPGDTFGRIANHDALIFDTSGNVVGVRNPNGSGEHMRVGGTLTAAQVSGLKALVSGAGNAATITLFGDSIADQHLGVLSIGINNVTQARGSFNHYNALTGGKFRLIGNGGVSSTTSGPWSFAPVNAGGNDWLSRIDAVLALGASHIWIGYPENDQVFGVPFADTIANLTAIHVKCATAGVRIIQATGLGDSRGVDGNSAPGNTVAKMQEHFVQVMAWLREKARKGSYLLWEQHAITANQTTGAPLTNVAVDTIHQTPYGAGLVAVYNSTRVVFPDLPMPEYQAFANWRNWFPNGLLLGAGGVATGFVGTAPDAVTLYKAGTIGIPVASTAARTDGKPGSYYTLTATSGAANDQLGISFLVAFETVYSAKVWNKFDRVRGSFGDHWIVTVAGTSTGTAAQITGNAFALTSVLGQTCTDLSGTVTFTRVETINIGDKYEVIAALQIIGCSSIALGIAPIINVSAAAGGGRALNRTVGEAQAQCYGQTSATPAALDKIIRTPPISHDGATTQVQAFVYVVMDNGLTATLAIAWVDCRKVIAV